jgi:hypothetical protein
MKMGRLSPNKKWIVYNYYRYDRPYGREYNYEMRYEYFPYQLVGVDSKLFPDEITE